jgi:methyltransferase (TIGR00027 family)
MRPGKPSLTAMFVNFARAVGTAEPELSPACHDPAAAALSAGPFRRLLEHAQHARGSGRAYRILRHASAGLVDHVALRTAVIDERVREGLARGARQLVILGAGFDGRAYRMRELAECVVFEVDHPGTQALKRKKASALELAACELRYAACDFERVSLEQALSGVRFDPAAPSVWIWEGVTMDLPREAVGGTLDVLGRLAAPGSTLVVSYVTPALTRGTPWVGRIGAQGLRSLSEPIRFTATPVNMQALLTARGFQTMSDVLPREEAARYGATVSRFSLVRPDERVLAGVRRPQ